MRLRHIGLAVFVLTLLVLLIASPILAGPAHQAAPPAQGTTTASANLRADPGTTFAKTGALPAGATVKITGCNCRTALGWRRFWWTERRRACPWWGGRVQLWVWQQYLEQQRSGCGGAAGAGWS
jgi:hypothetical protein